MARNILSAISFNMQTIKTKLLAVAKFVGVQQSRCLEIHENLAYTLLNKAGIPTPPFHVAKSAEEAGKHAEKFKDKEIVLKAQVLAGGRGKGRFKGETVGGVLMCETPAQAKSLASKMVGKLLVTKQTGAAGRICNSVMVTTRMYPKREFYIAVMLERAFNGPVIIVSKQGGVNIEEVAASNPEAVIYIPVDPKIGLTIEQADMVANKLEINEKDKEYVSNIACNLYELFVDKDALLLEVNPFAQDICGKYYALDCKCRFDDSASYRQKELFALEDKTQQNPAEVEAKKYDLNYIALDGNIGCMVNGAGLAMATMDIIKLYGGLPANFLDVSGSATTEAVKAGFRLITGDPKVHAIFVNIFGGIIKCDIIAQGIIDASQELKIAIPLVVRLQGTNVEKARKLIQDAKLKVITEDDFATAAETAVKLALMVHLASSLNLDINFTPQQKKVGGKKC